VVDLDTTEEVSIGELSVVIVEVLEVGVLGRIVVVVGDREKEEAKWISDQIHGSARR
jgi:hypothetical protein